MIKSQNETQKWITRIKNSKNITKSIEQIIGTHK